MTQTQNFAQLFRQHPLNSLFANINAQADIITLGNTSIPCTIVHRITPNCYTVSPHAAIIDYAKDELHKLPYHQQIAARALLASLSQILRLAQIDRIATLNNYCLSTNSLSPDFQAALLPQLTRTAVQTYPSHALAIRSLNPTQHPEHLRQLTQLGWQLIVSRQVYIMDNWHAAYAKTNTKRDQKLLADPRYPFIPLTPQSPDSDFQAAQHWYNQLYLRKYSRQNVQFTPHFLQQAVAQNILKLWLLHDTHTRQSIGTVGIVTDGTHATCPIVGYDTQAPGHIALYRRCMAHAMQQCRQRRLMLNFSSGASQFKILRGAQAQLEYMAIYTRHLPARRRAVWTLLQKISHNYYAPMLVKYRL